MFPPPKKGIIHGWTLGAFVLTSARLKDLQGLRKDFSMILECNHADKNYIQFYESSNRDSLPFYMTTTGLFMEAITECFIQDYRGFIEVFPINLSGRFSKLRCRGGFLVSGEYEKENKLIIVDSLLGNTLSLKIPESFNKSKIMDASGRTILYMEGGRQGNLRPKMAKGT